MQVVEADLQVWRSLPTRVATILMAVIAGAYAVPAGLIVGAVAFFALCVVRRQFAWIPARSAWGFITIVWSPLSRLAFWLSLAFLFFGLWRQDINLFWGVPLFVGWRVAIMVVERTKLALS